jgi:hypothetical protein
VPPRNLVYDATSDDLFRNLTPGPLADRTSGPLWRFTGQLHNPAHLLVADPSRFARTGRITQTVRYRQILQAGWLQDQPTLPPKPDHVDTDAQLALNLGVVLSLSRSQNNACAQGYLLRCTMAPNQLVQGLSFGIG